MQDEQISIEDLKKEASKLFQEGKLKEASKIYLDIIKSNNKDHNSLFQLGRIKLQQGQITESINSFSKATELSPKNEQYLLNLGAALMENFHFSKAISQYQKLLEINPNSIIALISLGDALRKNGQFEKSIETYAKTIESGNYTRSYAGSALAFVALGKMNEANTLANDALKIDSNDYFAYYTMARIKFAQKNYTDSELYLEKSINLRGNFLEALDLKANLCIARNKIDLAIEIFTNIIRQKPNYSQGHLSLGKCYNEKNQLNEALLHLEKAFNLDNNNSIFVKALANQYCAVDRRRDAVAMFKKLSELEPNSSTAISNYGALLMQEMYETDLAITVLESGVEQFPTNNTLLFNLVNAYMENHQFDKSAEFAELLLQTNTNYKDLDAHLEKIISSDKKQLNTKDINYINSCIVPRQTQQLYNILGMSQMTMGLYVDALNSRFKSILILIAAQEKERTIAKQTDFNDDKPNKALKSLKDILYPQNIHFFLAFGTLLGAVRQGDFLSHDKDIDVGLLVDSENELEQILSHIEKDGNFKVVKQMNNEARKYNIILKHKKLHIGIDLFIFYKNENGKRVTGLDNHNDPLLWEFAEFDLKKHNFINDEFYVPANDKQQLEEIYGSEWTIPDDCFDTIISAYNILKINDISYGLEVARLSNSLKNGHFAKTKKICNILKKNNFKHNIIKIVENHIELML